MKDIQAALLSSCKDTFSDDSVNFICKDGVVSCDRTVLILLGKFWKNIFISSNSDTDVVLTPDYSSTFIKNYIHSSIYSDYSIKDTDEGEVKGILTSDAGGTKSLDIGMIDLEEGVFETKDVDDKRLEINMTDEKKGVCLENNKENVIDDSKLLISSLVDEFVNILCEVCVEVLETEDPNILYFISPEEQKKIKVNCTENHIRNTKISRKTKKIILNFNPCFNTFKVKESTSCNICLKTFSKPAHCRVHMRHAHSEENKFGCNQCERKFKSKKGLDTHLKTSHENESKNPFICSACGHVFLEKRSLIRHCNTNCTATKSSSESKVKNQSDLKSRVYNSKRMRECTKCDFKTARNDKLLRHEREVHQIFDMELEAIKDTFDEGEKSFYKCPNCKKTLTTSEEVGKHVVNKVCLLTCNVCEKKFTRKENLKRHLMKIHQMEVGVSLDKKEQ